jgi:hypothetical protein
VNKQPLPPVGALNRQSLPTDTGPQLQPAEERRRSQRVIIQVPVTLELTVSGTKMTVHAKTASVNDQGAMLICTRNFPMETKFDLVNDRTAKKQSCRVTRAATENHGGYLIPVEFAAAAPGFWHISFPPPGWRALEN